MDYGREDSDDVAQVCRDRLGVDRGLIKRIMNIVDGPSEGEKKEPHGLSDIM